MHDDQYSIVPSFDRLTDVNIAQNFKAAMPIISKFTARTNGSYVKLSHCSIGWSYYSCDPEWGSLQASYLVAELGEALQSFDVRFVALKGIVEGKCDITNIFPNSLLVRRHLNKMLLTVVPRKGHKGQIVKKILENCKEVDFVLCMGDDISDEKMFTVRCV
jgi:trehalose 6-phosphate synthase/phosphatase